MAALPKNELVIGGYWTEGSYQQISAQGHIADTIWSMHVGKSGRRWLLPVGEEANTQVIVEGDGPNSQGFGGATLTFKLGDGSKVQLKGPWSSNHDSFYQDTGIDRRANYRTWGCIGRDHDHTAYEYGYGAKRACIIDLIYVDPEGGVIGTYDRIEHLARKLAFERQEVLAYHSQSYGGSVTCGAIFPSEGDPEYIAWRKKARWGAKKPEPWATMDALAKQKRIDTFGDYKYDAVQYIADDQWIEGIDVRPSPPPSPAIDFDEELDAFEEADYQGYY